MPITPVGIPSVTNINDSSSNTEVIGVLPVGGSNGNLLIAYVVSSLAANPGSCTQPVGWIPITNDYAGGFRSHSAASYRYRTGDENLTWIVSSDARDDQLIITEWAGDFDPTDAVTLVSAVTSDFLQSYVAGSLTPTTLNSLLISCCASKSGESVAADDTGGPTGMTTLYNRRTRVNSFSIRSAIAYQELTTLDPTGTRTWENFVTANSYGSVFNFIINASSAINYVNPTGTDVVLTVGDSAQVTLQNLDGAEPTAIAIRFNNGGSNVDSVQADFVYTPSDVDSGVIDFTVTLGNVPYGTSNLQYLITLDAGGPVTYPLTSLDPATGSYIIYDAPVNDDTGIIYQYDTGAVVISNDVVAYPDTVGAELGLSVFADGQYELFLLDEEEGVFPESVQFDINYWSSDTATWFNNLEINLSFVLAFAENTPMSYVENTPVVIGLVNLNGLTPTSIEFNYLTITETQSDFVFTPNANNGGTVAFTVTRGDLPYFNNLSMTVVFDNSSELVLEDITLNAAATHNISVHTGTQLSGVVTSILDSYTGIEPEENYIVRYPLTTTRNGSLTVNSNWTYNIQYAGYVQYDTIPLELWDTSRWISYTKTLIVNPPVGATTFDNFSYAVTYRNADNKIDSTDPDGDGE